MSALRGAFAIHPTRAKCTKQGTPRSEETVSFDLPFRELNHSILVEALLGSGQKQPE